MRQKISVRGIIKQDSRVLLLRRASGRPSILGKYELPGGGLEFGEQPEDTLRRHVKTYLGSAIETLQLRDVLSFIDPDDSETQYVFIVYLVSLGNTKLIVSDRYDKYLWQEMQNIQQNLMTHSASLLLGLAQSDRPKEEAEQKNASTVVPSTSEEVIIYSDGGSRGNPGPSASAFVIMDKQEQVIAEGGVYLGVTTNNQAEYQAVHQALKKAQELNIKSIDFRLDSNLVVSQLNGVYKIKNRDLWPIYQDIKELVKQFEKISFIHIPREQNYLADKLVNKILDEQRSVS